MNNQGENADHIFEYANKDLINRILLQLEASKKSCRILSYNLSEKDERIQNILDWLVSNKSIKREINNEYSLLD